MVDDIDRGMHREELYDMIDRLREDMRTFRRIFQGGAKMPEPIGLKRIGTMAKFPEDHERGKQIQRELGLSRIPPKSECEGGAGLWDRIAGGGWRELEQDNPDAP